MLLSEGRCVAGVGIDGEMRLLCLEADDGPAMTPQLLLADALDQRSRWGSLQEQQAACCSGEELPTR